MSKVLWWLFVYTYNKIFPREKMYSEGELIVRLVLFVSLLIGATVLGIRELY